MSSSRPLRCRCLAVLLLAITVAMPAAAAEDAAARLPPDAVTQHRIQIGGRDIPYTATAGTLPLKDEKGEATAQVFYVAFIRDGITDPAKRPITYAFNGGPGAASAYLDIGALGPRAIDLGPPGKLLPPSAAVGDNPDTWLPFTDLVFIDPVGTGWSRGNGSPDEVAKRFWGVKQDLQSLAQTIRLSLTRLDRLTSPVYLVGESYGGFRAARLADELASTQGIAPAGAMLISPALEFRLMEGDPLDVLPWALALPSYAAAALSAKGPVKPEALRDAEHFALNDYLLSLAAGPANPQVAQQLYGAVAQLIGLDTATVARWRGRVPLAAFVKELRRGNGEIVSRYDGSVAGPDPQPRADRTEDDPVLEGSIAPFTRAFVSYARDELGFKTDLPFELLHRAVSRRWDWSSGGGRHALGAAEALQHALALQPKLHLLIAHGITDLQTPYMTSRYVVDHLPAGDRPRIELKLYEGGHMMYLHPDSRRRLHDDALAFYGGGEE